MEFYEVIAKRRTIRKFTGPATEAQLMRILTAGAKAPSGMNQQRWEFIVVDDPALIERIAERKYVLNRGNIPRGEAAASPEVEKAAQAQKDSYANGSHVAVYYKEGGRDEAWLCIENMSLAAVVEGLGTRISFFRAGAEKDIDTILQVPPGYALACVLSIGVPALEPPAPTLRPEGSWLHHNKF
jgi:nitroreductase